jgi:EmrB/QacA subfamily drug resistance transporter
VIVSIACVAQFMVVLDVAMVNVALPAMRAGLGMSANGQEWVVNAYLVSFGGFTLLAARAGDLLGRKRILQAGLAIFTLASLVGGLAANEETLLAARLVQGAGAAALAPASLSLITGSRAGGQQRRRAIAYWGAAASVSIVVGLPLGGVLTAELNWRWVFFINLPIGIALMTAASAYRVSAPARRRTLDVPGALTATLGTTSLVYGISRAASAGWGSRTVVAALTMAAAAYAAFVVIEMRSASPLVPFSIFRHRNLGLANLIMACLGIEMTSLAFFLSLYLQQILGYSALRAGIYIAPWAVVTATGAFAARRLTAVIGARSVLTWSTLLTASGLAWLSALPAQPAYLSQVLGPIVLAGAGMGLMLFPVTITATDDVMPHDADLASGLVTTGRQVGGAIGLAALLMVAGSVSHDSGLHAQAAVLHGYRAGLLAAAGVSVAGGIAALFIRKPARLHTPGELDGSEVTVEPLGERLRAVHRHNHLDPPSRIARPGSGGCRAPRSIWAPSGVSMHSCSRIVR